MSRRKPARAMLFDRWLDSDSRGTTSDARTHPAHAIAAKSESPRDTGRNARLVCANGLGELTANEAGQKEVRRRSRAASATPGRLCI